MLEINPLHPLVQRLNREPADPHLAEWAHVLFNQAVLTLGARIETGARLERDVPVLAPAGRGGGERFGEPATGL